MDAILDFGEKGFPGILVETIAIFINNLAAPANTKVFSLTHRLHLTQPQAYIFDPELPYWIIYRNQLFDSVCRKLDFDVFEVFRDRQLTNKLLSSSGELRVLKSRNLSDDGKAILDIPGYDSYISYAAAKPLSVFQYLDAPNVYLTPNMTYKPRMMKKPPHCVVNGSLAILIPKGGIVPTGKAACVLFLGRVPGILSDRAELPDAFSERGRLLGVFLRPAAGRGKTRARKI